MLNYELKGKVAHLTMDDGKANAVSHALIEALNNGLDRAADEANAVVLQGREGKFSAGFDLAEIKKGPAAAKALVDQGAHLMHKLFTFPAPLVAACTGHGIAAGGFMLLACDTRIGMTGPFKLGLNETAIGMTLPEFGYQLAKARINPSMLIASFVQAQLFDPVSAVNAGFLDEAVAPDQLEARALEVASQLAELPTATYAANKLDIRRDAIAAIKQSLNG